MLSIDGIQKSVYMHVGKYCQLPFLEVALDAVQDGMEERCALLK